MADRDEEIEVVEVEAVSVRGESEEPRTTEEADAAIDAIADETDDDAAEVSAWLESVESRLEALAEAEVRLSQLERENAELRAELSGHHHSDEREEVTAPEHEIAPIKPHPYRRLPRWI